MTGYNYDEIINTTYKTQLINDGRVTYPGNKDQLSENRLISSNDRNSQNINNKIFYIDRINIGKFRNFGINPSCNTIEYNFEDFRVRTLKSINNLNKMLTYTIGLVALLSEKINKREFVNRIIKESKSLRDKVYLWFYQLARGIYNIIKMAKTGIRKWENIRKTKQYNGQLSLV